MSNNEPLRYPAEGALEIGYVRDFYALLRAIDVAMPSEAILCLEGASIVDEVATFVEEHSASNPRELERNENSRKSRRHHMSLAGKNLSGLREIADHHAEPEVASHLMVYRDDSVLLWAHDAGYGYVQLSKSLGDETVAAFTAELGSGLRKR